MFFHNFVVKIYLWDVVFIRSSSTVVTDNLLECTRLCYRNATCSSFFFKQDDGSCHLRNRWIKPVTQSAIPTGVHYYQVHSDACNGYGYEIIRNEHVAMCVKISKVKTKWSQAKTECQSDGARLVKLDTYEKDKAILEILKNDYDGIYLHIGGYDPEENDSFKWTDGSALEYTNWGPDEPDSKDHCLLIRWKHSWTGWYGAVCNLYKYGRICEKRLNL